MNAGRRPETGAAVRPRGRRWVAYRRRYLAAHPLCRRCQARGIIRASHEIDHIVPIALGGAAWDPANHQALCIDCHQTKTVVRDMPLIRLAGGVRNMACRHGRPPTWPCPQCEREAKP